MQKCHTREHRRDILRDKCINNINCHPIKTGSFCSTANLNSKIWHSWYILLDTSFALVGLLDLLRMLQHSSHRGFSHSWNAWLLLVLCYATTVSGRSECKYTEPVRCHCNATTMQVTPTIEPSSHPDSDNSSDDTCRYQLLNVGSCLSLNTSTCELTSGGCPYDLKPSALLSHYITGYYMLQLDSNHTCSDVNRVMCGAMHRTGLLCSHCEESYGLSLYSRNWECVPCFVNLPKILAWCFYITLELIPITVFFLLVVVLDIQAATPPFSAYVFYCQFFALVLRCSNYARIHLQQNSFTPLRLFSLSVIEVWNLDFLRHIVPAFCVNTKISNFDSVFLEFSCAVFPLVFILVVYLGIELHARNMAVIVWMWRPFHKCFASWRRTWNPQASMVKTFVTFIVFSMNKLVIVSIYSLYTVNLFHSNTDTGHRTKVADCLYLDPVKKLNDIPQLTSLLLATFVLLVVIPMALNILYPLKCLRKLSCLKRCYGNQTLWYFMEAWQGHFKNATNAGSCCDFRYLGVLFFIHRLFILLILGFGVMRIQTGNSITIYLLVVIYLACIAMFDALARPYTHETANVLESLIFGLASLVVLVIFSIPLAKKQPHVIDLKLHANVILVATVFPSTVLMTVVMSRILRRLVQRLRPPTPRGEAEEGEEEMADRVAHPDQYTPLLTPARNP